MAHNTKEELDLSPESADQNTEHSFEHQISHSNIGTVNITTYNVTSPSEPPTSSFGQEDEKSQDEESTDLNQNIRYFHNRRVAGRNYIFHGEQSDDVTGTTPVVVKLLPHSDASIGHAKILKQLRHKNLVTVLHVGCFNLARMKHIFIALERCREINLRDQVLANKKQGKSFDSNSSLTYAKQLVDAVRYIHSENILHRDLKPCNVLLSSCKRHLKITDFAMGVQTEEKYCDLSGNISIRTDGYQPPEVHHKKVYTHLSEVFSLGLVLYFLWSNGGHPFGDDPDEWNINIKKNRDPKIDGVLIENASRAKELLMKMLHSRQEQRPSAEELPSFEIFRCKTAGIPKGGSLGNLISHGASKEEKVKMRPHASPVARKSGDDSFRRSAPNLSTMDGRELKGIMARSAWNNSSDITRRPKTSSESHEARPRGKTGLTKRESQNDKELFNSLVIFDKLLCGTRVYQPALNTWKPMHLVHSKMATRTFTAVSSNGYVYLLLSDRRFFRVQAAKPNAMWEYLPDTKHFHGDYPPAVTFGGKIYVVGSAGYEDCYKANVTECFDPIRNCWSDLQPMPDSRHHHAVVVERGRIWCVGGREGCIILNTVKCYDIYEEKWLSRPPMFYPRAMPSSVFYQQKVFVLGGYSASNFAPEMRLSSVEHFDPKTWQWLIFTPMHKPRAAFSALVINGCIYSVGGDKKVKGFHDEKNTIERYSHPEKKWCIINMKREIKIDCMSATAAYLLP